MVIVSHSNELLLSDVGNNRILGPGVPVAMFYVVDRFAAVYHGRGGLIIFSARCSISGFLPMSLQDLET